MPVRHYSPAVADCAHRFEALARASRDAYPASSCSLDAFNCKMVSAYSVSIQNNKQIALC